MKYFFIGVIFLLTYSANGQNCGCKHNPSLKSLINCTPKVFGNKSQLVWSFNCDSSWLTFISPAKKKKILYSLPELVEYTGRLGYSFCMEYPHSFLIKNSLVSGCCDSPEYVLFDKTTGEMLENLGALIFYSEDKNVPIAVGIDAKRKHFVVYSLKNMKKAFVRLKNDQLFKNLKENDFPENYFEIISFKNKILKISYLKENGSKEIVEINVKKLSYLLD